MKRATLSLLSILFLISLCTSCFRNSPDKASQVDHVAIQENRFAKQNFNLQQIEDLYAFFTYPDDNYPLVSAHRGGPMKHYPENAIETFAYHAKQFPLIIECDVRISKDSVLVLMHDETLDRTSTGKGKVRDYTLAELKKLRLKDNMGGTTPYSIPTLEEVLLWGKGKVIFTLDVKNDVPYSLLSHIITKTHAESYSIIITYNAAQAKAMNRVNPELMISVSIKSEKDWYNLVKHDIPDNRLVAFIGSTQPKSELKELLHNHGVKLILGTHGNLDRQAEARGYQVYADYIINGTDILSTDRPIEAQKALDFYIRKHNITSPFVNK